jgi:hypothetical protein
MGKGLGEVNARTLLITTSIEVCFVLDSEVVGLLSGRPRWKELLWYQEEVELNAMSSS